MIESKFKFYSNKAYREKKNVFLQCFQHNQKLNAKNIYFFLEIEREINIAIWYLGSLTTGFIFNQYHFYFSCILKLIVKMFVVVVERSFSLNRLT